MAPELATVAIVGIVAVTAVFTLAILRGKKISATATDGEKTGEIVVE
jgi:hypothetical protein